MRKLEANKQYKLQAHKSVCWRNSWSVYPTQTPRTTILSKTQKHGTGSHRKGTSHFESQNLGIEDTGWVHLAKVREDTGSLPIRYLGSWPDAMDGKPEEDRKPHERPGLSALRVQSGSMWVKTVRLRNKNALTALITNSSTSPAIESRNRGPAAT